MNEKQAISIMEDNRHILGLPDQGHTWKPNANTIACDMAIVALQEKLERDKGCKYCNTDNKFTETGLPIIQTPYLCVYIAKKPLSDTYYLVTDEFKETSNIKGQYDNAPFRSNKAEIYACPMCGKKLERR